MPATKKIAPKSITLTIAGVGTRDTASGKHSAYPKRPPVAAKLELDGKTIEVKRVSGAYQNEKLDFIYWLQDGIARWTDLTPAEAKAIDGGANIVIVNKVEATPPANEAKPEATPAEPPKAEPKPEPKRQRSGRKVKAEA